MDMQTDRRVSRQVSKQGQIDKKTEIRMIWQTQGQNEGQTEKHIKTDS